ncbi:hypothetical protein TOI97_13145 [Denitrificimonas sp. JX-1]|uniref:Transposase n=1 Tax=Denitrificimonas halotolerans TaxID=3098930 RepID=A0ABU5GXY3_9GAMM|nr:hypothetical protein [Denitrificimonas sp. JX-1]MDY7220498.1 hypothetical protein [Denitrificimonas sp. JX-1]
MTHDSDINAAKNILAAGHRRLAVGIPVLYVGEDVKPIDPCSEVTTRSSLFCAIKRKLISRNASHSAT